MEFNQLFDVDQCNELLDIHSKNVGTPDARKRVKTMIQKLQINMAVKSVLDIPHMDYCIATLRILGPESTDPEFMAEMVNYFDTEYGDNVAVNYAIALKQMYSSFDQQQDGLLEMLRIIDETEIGQAVNETKKRITEFDNTIKEQRQNAFNRFELLVEHNKYDRMISIISGNII